MMTLKDQDYCYTQLDKNSQIYKFINLQISVARLSLIKIASASLLQENSFSVLFEFCNFLEFYLDLIWALITNKLNKILMLL